jgi:hypothetical protein
LSHDIEENVRFHCDRHVVKMILESVQLLSAVHHCTGTGNYAMYKVTHKNHPCNVWARSSSENYAYLYSLAMLLGEEYTYRYGKVHKSISVLDNLPYPSGVPVGEFTTPAKCVHDDFKVIEDVVEAYREYYKRDKRAICTWTGRDTPYWF